jgi:alcohol dehydrogenase class IV
MDLIHSRVCGGSPLTVAKSVWAFYENGINFAVITFNLSQLLELQKGKLCAIPTTSGTGRRNQLGGCYTRIKEDGTHNKLNRVLIKLIPPYAMLIQYYLGTHQN